tara:strand:- start:1647 stop:2381 length:735 start_codon:yes stop_codon:yes gene_type:complete
MDLKKTKTSFKLSNRQDLILDRLKIFYTHSIMDILLPIINGETKLSLRIIDWFVTNYTKKNNIILYNKKKKLVTNTNPKNKFEQKTKKSKYEYVDYQFNIYLNYKSQLKAYSKKNFDPFCRRERINFFYNTDKYITTTVGQLNFFKWAIDNNILDYINENLEKIDSDMNLNIKRHDEKTKKSKKTSLSNNKSNLFNNDISLKSIDLYKDETKIDNKSRRKRRELSCSANNSLNKHKFSITLEFE